MKKLLLVIVFSICMCFCSSVFAADDIQYYPIKDGNKWGLIDKNGKVVLAPKFDYLDIKSFNFREIAKVRVGNKYGVINDKGKYIVKPLYDNVNISIDENPTITFSNNGSSKTGLITRKGKVKWITNFKEIRRFCTDNVSSVKDNKNEEAVKLDAVLIDGKFELINSDGKIIVNPMYDDIGLCAKEIYKVKLNNKWGLMDYKGNIIIEPTYDYIGDFSEELAEIKLNDKYGHINSSGEIVIEPKYDYAGNFSEDLVNVTLGNKSGYINKEGKVVIDFKYDFATPFINGYAVVGVGKDINGDLGIIDKNGKMIIEPKYQHVFLDSEDSNILARVYKDIIKIGLVDRQGNLISEPKFDDLAYICEGKSIVKINDKYGIIDSKGKYIVRPKFSNCMLYNDKYLIVEYNNKWGIIDTNGKYIIRPTYNYIGQKLDSDTIDYTLFDNTDNNEIELDYLFSSFDSSSLYSCDDFIPVCKKNKYGFLDKDFKTVIQPKYDDIYMYGFINDLLLVKIGDKLAYIDKKDNIVWKENMGLISMETCVIPEKFIAHAGGRVKGHSYTSSLEALNENYNKGFHFFEMDIDFTSDNELAMIHDWENSISQFFGKPQKKYSLQEFNSFKMIDNLTQLNFYDFAKWLKTHKDAYIITDIKEDNLKALLKISSENKSIIQRVIPQIYTFEEYDAVKDMGYNNIILTLYMTEYKDEEILDFLKTHNVLAITMPEARANETLPKKLNDIGVFAYAHTINDLETANNLKLNGVNGFYSDDLIKME